MDFAVFRFWIKDDFVDKTRQHDLPAITILALEVFDGTG